MPTNPNWPRVGELWVDEYTYNNTVQNKPKFFLVQWDRRANRHYLMDAGLRIVLDVSRAMWIYEHNGRKSKNQYVKDVSMQKYGTGKGEK